MMTGSDRILPIGQGREECKARTRSTVRCGTAPKRARPSQTAGGNFPTNMAISIFAACVVFLYVVVIGASARASEKPQIACDQLTAVRIGTERLSISFAKSVQSDEKTSMPHCVLRGALEERTGLDGKPYAIGFEMRLPDAWNGRYFHQANGGADGEVVPAYGPLLGGDGTKNALTLGYAVLSSDAGHDGKAFPEYVLAGGSAFGLDPQARLDYGYTSTPKLFRLAQDVLKAYYGRAQDYSYMVGCSNGGRHAMIAASRYPQLFHGILAGSPGFDLPRAALKGPSDTQAVLKNGLDIRSAFSREDLQFVSREIVRTCDMLDGAADETVGDMKACQKAFDLKSLQCTGEKSPTCLSTGASVRPSGNHGWAPYVGRKAALSRVSLRPRHRFNELAILAAGKHHSAVGALSADNDARERVACHDLYDAADQDRGKTSRAAEVPGRVRSR